MATAPVRFFHFDYQSDIQGDFNGVGYHEYELDEQAKSPDFLKKLVVCKSLPLVELCEKNELSLHARKMLDLYLARINPKDSWHRKVVIEKGVIERVFRVNRIRNETLNGWLKELLGTFEVRCSKGSTKTEKIRLFETARMEKDRKGIWQVVLSAAPGAFPLFFNIGSAGYLRYPFTDVAWLSCSYSYVLYLYIQANRFRGSWNIGFDDFKEKLGISSLKTYRMYSSVSAFVLKRAKNEIQKKTNLRFSFYSVRKGETTIGIHFDYETNLREACESIPAPTPYYDNSIPSHFDFETAVDELDPENIEAAVSLAVTPEGEEKPLITKYDLKPLIYRVRRSLESLTVSMAIDTVRRAFIQCYERYKNGTVKHFGGYLYTTASAMLEEEIRYTKAFDMEFSAN